MILVTVGTQLTFDRLIKAVEKWCIENDYTDIVFQTGKGAYQPKVGKVYDFINAKEIDELFESAEVIIGHAGMGTILTCLTASKPLVIMPRLFKYQEHRNDHQQATYNKVKDLQGIFAAKDELSLTRCINNAISAGTVDCSLSAFAEQRLTDYIRQSVSLDD